MPKPIIKCKLCGEEGPAADAHIIPRAFYEQSKGVHDHLKVFDSLPGTWPKKSRTGFYDSQLLCQRCEGKFHGLDTYGIQVLLQTPREGLVRNSDGVELSQIIRGINRERFAKFLAFLVWRMLASESEAFQFIRSPDKEATLRKLLLSPSSLASGHVEAVVTLMRHELMAPGELNRILNGSAYMSEWEGVPVVAVGLGDCLFLINLADRPLGGSASRVGFPACMDRMDGIPLILAPTYANNHVKVAREIMLRQQENLRSRTLARTVLKRFRSSFGRTRE